MATVATVATVATAATANMEAAMDRALTAPMGATELMRRKMTSRVEASAVKKV